jgi:Tfp pilus assembly protein PilE
MQQHMMALGYFFLAVLCVLTSAHTFVELRIPLLLAALLALVAGAAYVAGPLAARLRAVRTWLLQLIRIAQEPPGHTSATTDEKRA